MSRLELTTFGVPHIKIDGRSVEQLSSRKAQALLIYLAATRQQHSRQALAGLLWGEMSEEKARRNLRVTLTRIRVPLENHLIIRRRSLRIDDVDNVWLDVSEFESCLASATPTLEQLQRAATLYQGHFLNDFALRDAPLFEEWVRPLQERYRQMAMEAIYRLAKYHTEQKQYSTAITLANRLLLLEPWMEEAHRQLMLLLALSGQRSAALTQYDSCRNMLLEELGVEPAAATVDLYEQILREDIQPDAQKAPIELTPTAQATPIQIPAAVKHFVGRSAEMVALEQVLCVVGKPQVQALVGMGGIGKSSLAIQLARGVQKEFPDGVLWANAATSEPMAILESWASAYGYDFTRIADLESMAAAFRGVLAEKRVLIVLDDVTSVSRMRPLLPGGEQCRVLLTTRDQDLARALNAQVWPLHELSPENGRLLLGAILGQNRVVAEAEAADEICALLQNLPLALEITAQRLKSRPRRQLAQMAQRLRDETQRLSLLRISDREVRVSFAVSWEALDAERRRVFALIGLFNGRSFIAEAIAHITNMEQYPAEDRLFDLVNLSLLREEEGRRYRQHPLLADFAREQLGEDVGEVYGRFASYYLHFAQQNQHDYDALRPEWDNLMAAMEAAHTHQLWQTVIDFADALHDAWFTRGRFSQARIGYKWAKLAAAEIKSPKQHADSCFYWGLACLEQSNYEEAISLLNQCLAEYQRIKDLAGTAKVQANLARIALNQARYDEAAKLFTSSKLIKEKIKDQTGIAEIMKGEARLAYRLSDYQKAYAVGCEALLIYKNADDKLGTVQTLGILVNSLIELHRQGDDKLALARSYSEHALDLAEIVRDQGELAVAQYGLSRVLTLSGQYIAAEEAAKQSLLLLEKIGDQRTRASVLMHLSENHFYQKDYHAALETASIAIPIISQLNTKNLEAVNWWNIGHFHNALAEHDQAKAAWSYSFEIAQEINDQALLQRLRPLL